MIPAVMFANNTYIHLPILIVVISLVYSATRYERWDNILKEAFRWGVRMLVFLIVIVGLPLYILGWLI